MTTYTFQFTTSENKKIQSALVKGTSKENAVEKFYKKHKATMITLLKVYECA